MARSMKQCVKIGGASGFWGDSEVGARQMVRQTDVDYILFDYLAEITMSILAKAHARRPEAGYATDFVTVVMRKLLREIAEKRVKVITNAGGINPNSCAKAIQELAEELEVSISIAVVSGDDLIGDASRFQNSDIKEMFSGAELPSKLISANAYLGAFPIARALDLGADIVVTGRCVDSALALGPLIHEFGWNDQQFNELAAGSLIGHLIECGAQATGGNHTDWDIVPDWENIGFPIAECHADGSFILTKPDKTGGLVTPAIAAEQLVYEIGDPANYLLPDVACDFTDVTMQQIGVDRVKISGARGRAPTPYYKVSATYNDGWRCTGGFTVVGMHAEAKARRAADTVVARTNKMLRDSNLGELTAVEIELLGSGSLYGNRAVIGENREVVLRLSVTHPDQEALKVFARELAPMGTGGAPGSTGFFGGRPKPQEVIRLFSFLLHKSEAPPLTIRIDNDDPVVSPVVPGPSGTPAKSSDIEPAELVGDEIVVPLMRLAVARSGDKGNTANIGVIARDPRFVGVLARELPASRIQSWFSHVAFGDTERYYLPGISAFNYVLTDALGGGGLASLRNDPQGKSYSQILLEIPVHVSAAMLEGYCQRKRP